MVFAKILAFLIGKNVLNNKVFYVKYFFAKASQMTVKWYRILLGLCELRQNLQTLKIVTISEFLATWWNSGLLIRNFHTVNIKFIEVSHQIGKFSDSYFCRMFFFVI